MVKGGPRDTMRHCFVRVSRGFAHDGVMGRRKDDGLFSDIFKTCYDLFQHVPIWVGPCVAVVSFALFYWIAPYFVVKANQTGHD